MKIKSPKKGVCKAGIYFAFRLRRINHNYAVLFQFYWEITKWNGYRWELVERTTNHKVMKTLPEQFTVRELSTPTIEVEFYDLEGNYIDSIYPKSEGLEV